MFWWLAVVVLRSKPISMCLAGKSGWKTSQHNRQLLPALRQKQWPLADNTRFLLTLAIVKKNIILFSTKLFIKKKNFNKNEWKREGNHQWRLHQCHRTRQRSSHMCWTCLAVKKAELLIVGSLVISNLGTLFVTWRNVISNTNVDQTETVSYWWVVSCCFCLMMCEVIKRTFTSEYLLLKTILPMDNALMLLPKGSRLWVN